VITRYYYRAVIVYAYFFHFVKVKVQRLKICSCYIKTIPALPYFSAFFMVVYSVRVRVIYISVGVRTVDKLHYKNLFLTICGKIRLR
jgi:hypothetical protein